MDKVFPSKRLGTLHRTLVTRNALAEQVFSFNAAIYVLYVGLEVSKLKKVAQSERTVLLLLGRTCSRLGAGFALEFGNLGEMYGHCADIGLR